MKNTILVDLDGVLRHWSNNTGCLENKYKLALGSIHTLAFSSKLLHPAIRGLISDTDWRDQIATQLAQAYPLADTHAAITEWSDTCGEIDKKTLKLLSECKAQANIILTTNATSRLTLDLRKLEITHLFDAIVNSSDIGFIKPEDAFFTHALKVAGADTSHVIFIDDTLDNVNKASTLGINSHHFKNVKALGSFLGVCGFELPTCGS